MLSVAVVCAAGLLWLRADRAEKARRVVECRALTKALDKTVRQKSERIFEGIPESRWDGEAKRCLASLEYHYKPCDAAGRKKNAAACAGPDADIAIYTFLDGGAHPLIVCERYYATGVASCSESVYGVDGALLTSRELPPDQFPAIKAGMMGTKP
jgi:hypothetical protein